jgi:hypothetical protein
MNLQDLAGLQARAERELKQGRSWTQIFDDLWDEDLDALNLAMLLRSMGAWRTEAKLLKRSGHAFEDIIGELRGLCATWVDVALAMIHAGLSPADMLRVVLPDVDDSEAHWNVAQVAVCLGPEDSDYEEVRQVLRYFRFDAEDVVEHVLGPEEVKQKARVRLGLVA